MGRKILFGVLGLVLLGALWWVVSLFIGNQVPEATPTPTPTPTMTLVPTVKTLQTYFRGAKTTGTDLKAVLATAQPTAGQALIIEGTGPATQVLPASTDLTASLGTDALLMAFGQTEAFDDQGQIIPNASTETRLVMITEVTDATKANQAMQTLEAANLASFSAEWFGYDTRKAIANSFSSGTYRQTAVRYWNFPYADHALDWAIVAASNNKNYLVVTGSRESMFYTIDQLLQ